MPELKAAAIVGSVIGGETVNQIEQLPDAYRRDITKATRNTLRSTEEKS